MAATRRTEILEERIEGGERRVLYRWRITGGEAADGKPIPDSTGTGWAAERVEPMSRELLLDRWYGLIGSNDWTELGEKLYFTLTELADGLTRRNMSAETARVTDEGTIGLDVVMDIDGLGEMIREWLIERAAKVATR